MKIQYISASTLLSGDANAVHVACMCEAFAKLGHTVTLRARRAARNMTDEVFSFYGLQQHYSIDFENRLTHRLWRTARWVERLLPQAPDGIIWYGRNLPAMQLLSASGRAVVLELHSVPRPAKLALVRKFLRGRNVLGLVVISEALSKSMRSLMPELEADAVFVAHDGFRSDMLRTPALRGPGEPIRAVYAGSFHRGKGINVMLDAARLLPQIEFHVFGGTASQVDAARVAACANVRLHGKVPHADVDRLLPGFDIALAPYGRQVHGIGQRPDNRNLADHMSPLKLFEYMAAGLPIVTSNLPVIGELLQADKSALLVEPDHPAALAAAISRLADNACLRLELATAAQSMLAGHSWDRRASRIADFLRARIALADRRRGETQP